MGAWFGGAARIERATSMYSAYPFTVCGWVYPTAASGRQTVWAVDNGTSSNTMQIYTSTAAMAVDRQNLGTIRTTTCAAVVHAQAWTYFIARFIATANMRLSALDSTTGQVVHAQDTGSTNFQSMDHTRFGASDTGFGVTDFLTGSVAEWWCTDIDIQADNGALSDDFVRQMAFNGPWSNNFISSMIREYRSFYKTQDDSTDTFGDNIDLKVPAGTAWKNAGTAPTLGPHPPLQEPYLRAFPVKRRKTFVLL